MKTILDVYCGTAAIDDGKKLLASGQLRSYSRTCDAAGRTVLFAKCADSFNFVDIARVVIGVSGNSIDSASCGCRSFMEEKGLCRHCAALLLKAEADRQSMVAYTVQESDPQSTENPPLEQGAQEMPENPETAELYKHAFRFSNTQKDLYPDIPLPEIPLERFEMMFGKNQTARKLYNDYGEWHGSCYGIAAACGLFRHPENDVSVKDYRPDAECPRDLMLTDVNETLGITLHSFIEAMFISQLSYYVSMFRDFMLKAPMHMRLQALTEAVESFERTGKDPVILDIYENDKGKGGHCVFPYRHERLDGLRSRLHIYDSNYPNEVRYFYLRRDKEGKYQSWRFNMFKDLEYSSEKGGTMEFIDREVYQKPWNERAGQHEQPRRALFSTPCEDLTLKDESGNDVLKIAAGSITPLRNDIVPIRVTDGETAKDRYDIWIDQGIYRVINDDPERELDFDVTGDQTSAKVQTDAQEIGFEVNDEEQIIKIDIVENKKPVIVRIYEFAKEVFLRCVPVIIGSAGFGAIMSKAGKLILKLITLDSISEFEINGEPADARAYISEDTEASVEDAVEEPFEEENSEEILLTNRKREPEE